MSKHLSPRKIIEHKLINYSIQKGFSVNENLHYLNITKDLKYKSNIKMLLDGSNPIIIVLNSEVLCIN